jgi:hypothetical protein
MKLLSVVTATIVPFGLVVLAIAFLEATCWSNAARSGPPGFKRRALHSVACPTTFQRLVLIERWEDGVCAACFDELAERRIDRRQEGRLPRAAAATTLPAHLNASA